MTVGVDVEGLDQVVDVVVVPGVVHEAGEGVRVRERLSVYPGGKKVTNFVFDEQSCGYTV